MYSYDLIINGIMASSKNPHITDELLSAYIDNVVTEDERRQVEKAVAEDPGVAWRLESLRHTVYLLNHLPELVPPRSFALTVEAVSAPATSKVAAPVSLPKKPQLVKETSGFGQVWRTLFQGGNLFLRNAAVGAALILLVLVGVDFALPTLSSIDGNGATMGAVEVATASVVMASAQPPATLAQAEGGVRGALSDAAATPEAALAQQATDRPEGEAAVAMRSAANDVANDVAAESSGDSTAENAPAENATEDEAADSAAALASEAPVAKQSAESVDSGSESAAALAVAPEAPGTFLFTPTPSQQDVAAAEMVTASSVAMGAEPATTAQADEAASPDGAELEESVDPLAADAGTGEEGVMALAAPPAQAEAATAAQASDSEAEIANSAEVVEESAASADVASLITYSTQSGALNSPVAADSANQESTARVAQASAPEPEEAASAVEDSVAVEPAAAQEPMRAPSDELLAVEESQAESVPAEGESSAAVAPAQPASGLAVPAEPGNALWYAQIIAAICTLGFALLWWRSRA